MGSNWIQSLGGWLGKNRTPEPWLLATEGALQPGTAEIAGRRTPVLLGEDQARSILEQTLAEVPAEHAEVSLYVAHEALTRFANNHIHQNVAEQNASLTVRAVEGKQVGIAGTNDLRPESLRRVAGRAAEIARSLPENPEFLELVRPTALPECPPLFFPGTASCSPRERAEGVRIFIERARREGVTAAGSFSTAETELGVVNTMGVSMYQAMTEAHFQSVVMDETGAGYAEASARDIAEIHPADLAEEAVRKCIESRNPREVEPGTYPVVLEEYAVAALVDFLAYMGLNARAYQEGRSCLCGKLGRPIASERLTLWDDGLDPRGLPVAFDFEGTAKGKTVFIDKGVVVGLAYDSFSANREGKMSTGHALPAADQSWGAFPTNLFLAPGEATPEQMVASLERGLYITRFHYTNVVEEMSSTITGMTRDGTWWIEDGKLAYPVKNLRFTQSILEALQGVRMVSGRIRRVEGGHVVPMLLLERFHFSSRTTF